MQLFEKCLDLGRTENWHRLALGLKERSVAGSGHVVELAPLSAQMLCEEAHRFRPHRCRAGPADRKVVAGLKSLILPSSSLWAMASRIRELCEAAFGNSPSVAVYASGSETFLKDFDDVGPCPDADQPPTTPAKAPEAVCRLAPDQPCAPDAVAAMKCMKPLSALANGKVTPYPTRPIAVLVLWLTKNALRIWKM